ncbi:MAG: tetratricopeptide repeat protein, partial [Planctomycetota bacterium]
MLQELADRVGMEIDGLRHIPSEQGATVRLEKRPLAQVLQYVVGAAGVRSSTTSKKIILRPALPPFPEPNDILDQADLAYRRALKYAPNSDFADQAEFALGRIAEERGQLDAALGHYDLLFDENLESSLVPDALFRAGNLRLDSGRFEDAALGLSALVALERDHPYGVDAHRMLALCTTQLGNHQRAIYHLDALEKEFPAETSTERARRDFIRARALIGLGEAASALRLLERKDSRLHSGRHPGERIELMAAAMQVHGRHGDASLAWMAYAKRASGPEQARAYGNAARLALLSKDELG